MSLFRETWAGEIAHRNLNKFSTENVKFCTWGGIIPCTRKEWGLTVWRAALQRVLVGSKLNKSQQCVLVARKASSIHGCTTKSNASRPRKVILLLNTGETHLEYWVK